VFLPHVRNTSVQFAQLPFRNEADLRTVLGLRGLFRGADAAILTRVRDYWLGGLAARLAGTPALLRLGIVRELRSAYLMDRLRYSILPHAAVVNAQRIRETLYQTTWMMSLPVHVVYNGVDAPGVMDDRRRAQLRSEWRVPEGALWMVGAGRLAVEKRWHLAVEAAARIARNGESVRLTIFGDGSERSRLKRLVREQRLEDTVRIPGHVDNASELLGAADMVLLPSDNEGVSNTMLEAMGQAVPVVATTAGGVRERLRGGREVLLTEPDDHEGYLELAGRAASDPAFRTAVGEAAFQAVRDRFGWAKMTDELIDVLNGMQVESL
jgi:glycosyltransferase involved in cell wall biosynthesis